MPEDYTVEWPKVPGAKYMHLADIGWGWWRPMPVVLEEHSDPWAHRLYAQSRLPQAVHPERRPRQGLLVLNPDPALDQRERELALILRMPRDPPGEEHRLRYRCLYLDDRHPDPGMPWEDWLVDNRRWIAIRSDWRVVRAATTRAEAIRHALQPHRKWVSSPAPEREAEPEGEDLVELGIVAEAHLGRG